MKITKRQLKRIIKEEKARILSEQSREAKEGALLADFNMVVTSIEEIAAGMYGLVDPGDPRVAAGDAIRLARGARAEATREARRVAVAP